MLTEGNRLKKRGLDVVIGYVEPHARPETTAQIGELEIVPPVVTQYRGVELREMDTAAVIARAPTVALVDELAHTNAPGSKTKKRYEDVEDLLAAGHQRHQHAQHPAPRKPVQRGGRGHRCPGERAHPGRVPDARGPDRQHRPAGGRPHRAVTGRQDLRAGPGGPGAHELLHPAEPHPPAGAGAERKRQLPGPPPAGGRVVPSRSTFPEGWARWQWP